MLSQNSNFASLFRALDRSGRASEGGFEIEISAEKGRDNEKMSYRWMWSGRMKSFLFLSLSRLSKYSRKRTLGFPIRPSYKG